MKHTFSLTVFLFAFMFLGIGMSPNLSRALTVGPAKLEFNLDPGASTTGAFFLLNEGDGAQTLYPVMEKFTEEGGEKKFYPGAPSEMAPWFGALASTTLAPRQSKNIPFTLQIPADAPPGGHFAVIWWSNAPPANQSAGGGASVVTRAGMLVFLNVSGQIHESATVSAFDANATGGFFSQIPDSFNVIFKNTGNTYLVPSGQIVVKDMLGMVDAIFSVNKYGMQILPQSEKTLRVAPESMRFGGFGFGFYEADMSLNYGEHNGQSLAGQTKFIVVTWRIIVPIAAGIILFVGAAIFAVKSYNRWIVKKALRNNQ